MAAGTENKYWWDVLENGPSSRFATWFDIDWNSPEVKLQNKVLIPVLGGQYGQVLSAGQVAHRLRRRFVSSALLRQCVSAFSAFSRDSSVESGTVHRCAGSQFHCRQSRKAALAGIDRNRSRGCASSRQDRALRFVASILRRDARRFGGDCSRSRGTQRRPRCSGYNFEFTELSVGLLADRRPGTRVTGAFSTSTR